MLQIQTRQMKVFEQIAMDRFRKRIAKMLCTVRSDLAERADPPTIARFCDRQISDAASIGFTTEFEVGVFCSVTLVHGLGWHLDPSKALYAIARRQGVSPSNRAANLRNALLGPKAWRSRRPKQVSRPVAATGARELEQVAA